MSKEVYFSVIILNWNGSHLLGDCLASLRSQTFRDFEIIVVDNGSNDNSCHFVREYYPEVRLIELSENIGFAGGNNRGFAHATGDFIFFLNNDTKAHPDMLRAIYNSTKNDLSDVGAWASKMLRWDDGRTIDNCGCAYTSFGSGFQIGCGEKDGPSCNKTELIFGASGGAGCYRRAVLNDIGLFDEDFFYNNEDVDLNFRLQLAGYRCRYVPEAVVYHRGSATAGAISERTVYHMLRNKEWVFYKNMPRQLLVKYIVPHLLYNGSWFVLWALRGKGIVAFRAYLHAACEWRSVLKKRREVQFHCRCDWHHIDNLIKKWHMPATLLVLMPWLNSKRKGANHDTSL